MATSVSAHIEYRYGCQAFDQLRIGLTAPQRSSLRRQTGYDGRRLDLAARIIEDNDIPHWFVWAEVPQEWVTGRRPHG